MCFGRVVGRKRFLAGHILSLQVGVWEEFWKSRNVRNGQIVSVGLGTCVTLLMILLW